MEKQLLEKIFTIQNELETIIKGVARQNTDFVCSTCLNTIDKLLDVYELASNDLARQELAQETNAIIERDLYY